MFMTVVPRRFEEGHTSRWRSLSWYSTLLARSSLYERTITGSSTDASVQVWASMAACIFPMPRPICSSDPRPPSAASA